MDLELKKQIEIVEQRLQYHFGGVNQKWEIPEGMPFMKEVLNEVAKLCVLAKTEATSDNSLHKHVVNARFDDSDEEDEDFEEEEPAYKECMCCGNVQQYGMSCNKCAGPTKDGFL